VKKTNALHHQRTCSFRASACFKAASADSKTDESTSIVILQLIDARLFYRSNCIIKLNTQLDGSLCGGITTNNWGRMYE
jgi:hypothetical protein